MGRFAAIGPVNRTPLTLLLIAALAAALAFAWTVSAADDDPALDPAGKPDHFTGEQIKDRRFAVVVVKEGEPVYFRDIGSALKWRAGECIATQVVCDASTWAFDYLSGRRIHMRAGYYVISPKIATPAGHGVVALEAEKDALEVMRQYGAARLYDFEQAQAYFQ